VTNRPCGGIDLCWQIWWRRGSHDGKNDLRNVDKIEMKEEQKRKNFYLSWRRLMYCDAET